MFIRRKVATGRRVKYGLLGRKPGLERDGVLAGTKWAGFIREAYPGIERL